jgi:hypothetical protein
VTLVADRLDRNKSAQAHLPIPPNRIQRRTSFGAARIPLLTVRLSRNGKIGSEFDVASPSGMFQREPMKPAAAGRNLEPPFAGAEKASLVGEAEQISGLRQ